MNLYDIKKIFYDKLNGLYDAGEIGMFYRLTIEEVFGFNLSRFIHYQNEVVDLQKADKVAEVVNRLTFSEPIQYILKKAWFYGLEFEVAPGVLIPRQETELLVDHLVRSYFFESPKKILDIGSGSGCIAITLKKNLPHCEVFATDISSAAIEITTRNASINNAEIEVFQSDIMNPHHNNIFDAVVSNPPYVCLSEKKMMHKNVTEFEPSEALYVEDDHPLKYYEAISRFCKKSLSPQGLFALEINERFGREVKELFLSEGYKDILMIKDLNHKDRIVTGRKND